MAVVGVGVDAVDIDRLARVLGRRPGVARRAFTDTEREYAARHRDPMPALAARFAAKEATMKALGVGLGAFGLRDVEVERDDAGAPRLALRGTAASTAADRGARNLHLSLTHAESVAVALVVAESA